MTNVTRRVTAQQQKALDWLINHGGHGTFDHEGQKITTGQGKTLHYRRETWVALRDAGRIEFYNNGEHETPFGAVRVINMTKGQ